MSQIVPENMPRTHWNDISACESPPLIASREKHRPRYTKKGPVLEGSDLCQEN